MKNTKTPKHKKPSMGWECPRCGLINCPTARYCLCPKHQRYQDTYVPYHPTTTPWLPPYEITCEGPMGSGQAVSMEWQRYVRTV